MKIKLQKNRGNWNIVNDSWVEPYNAALLLKYVGQINLEISSTRRVEKYLLKYILKALMSLCNTTVRENDEIEEFAAKLYVGATDATWRILEFQLTGRDPPVVNEGNIM